MNKLVFWVLAVLMISITLASSVMGADLNDSTNELYWTFDTGNYTGINPIDVTGNGNDGTGNTVEATDFGKINESFNFTQDLTDYVEINAGTNTIFASTSTPRTFSIWIYPTAYDAVQEWFLIERDNKGYIQLKTTSGQFEAQFYDTGARSVLTSLPTLNEWHHVVLTYNGSLGVMYIDGELNGSVAVGTLGVPSSATFRIGGHNAGGLGMTGMMDEFSVWDNRALNDSEVTELYNSGDGLQYPYEEEPVPVPSNVSHYVEDSLHFVQTGTAIITSTQYQTVDSATFEHNTTAPAYISYTLNAISTFTTGDLNCRVTVDGVDYNTEATRTQTVNQYGSWYGVSSLFNVTPDNHTLELECKRIGSANWFTISNAVGVLHLLQDSRTGTNLTFDETTLSIGQILNTGYELKQTILFETSDNNISVTEDVFKQIIVDLDLYYYYSAIDSTTTAIFELDGQNFSEYKRFGAGLTNGHGGATLVKTPSIQSNASQNITLKIFAKNSIGDGYLLGSASIKEQIQHQTEVNTTTLNNTNFNSNTYVDIKNLTVTNTDHATANLVVFAGIPHETTAGNARTTFRLKTVSENGTEIIRDISSGNRSGIAVLQDIFTISGVGTTTVILQGKSNNQVNINGGDLTAYFTSVLDYEDLAYEVTVNNHHDGTVLSGFNVTNQEGTIFEDINGTATVVPTGATDNLTISKEDYISRTILNHNTSTSLETTIWQVQADMRAFKIITGTELFGDFTAGNQTSNNTLYLNADSYNITFNTTWYFDKTTEFTFPALYDMDANITGVYDTVINITAKYFFDNSTINSFYGTVTNSSAGFSQAYTTTNGFAEIGVLNSSDYFVSISSTGYASTNATITVDETVEAHTFYLYIFNSVRINIYNETSKTLIAPGTTTINTLTGNETWINTTTTGTLVQDLLTPNDYEFRFVSSGFNPISKFVTVLNDSTQEINIYMTENVTTELQIVQVLDTASQPVEGAIVWLQKEQINSSDIWLTIQEAETDYNGQTSLWVERDTTIFYRFAVIYEGEAKPILPNRNLFTGKTSFIPGVTETIQLFVDIEEDAIDTISNRYAVATDLYFADDNFTAVFDWIDGRNSISGARLLVKGRYLYNTSLKYETITELTSNSTSGSLNYTLPNINNTQYIVSAYILFSNSEQKVGELTKTVDANVIIDKNTGLLYAVLIIAFTALITVTFGKPLISGIITFGVLLPLTLGFGLISIPPAVITSMIALVIIIFLRPKTGE